MNDSLDPQTGQKLCTRKIFHPKLSSRCLSFLTPFFTLKAFKPLYQLSNTCIFGKHLLSLEVRSLCDFKSDLVLSLYVNPACDLVKSGIVAYVGYIIFCLQW